MFSAALLTLLLVFSITRSPVKAGNSSISVPLTSRLHFSNGTNNLLERDRARLKALRDPSMRRQILANVPLRNDYMAYSIAVGIGSPPITYNLFLDSGSANTWVNAPAYVGTITTFCTGQPVAVTYGSGYFSGSECLDYVTVGPGLDILMQSIGVAEESRGFPNFDGVLGIGPAALTLGTMPELPREPIPTVTDNLFSQGTISEKIVGIFYQPYVNPPLEATGQITFGGTDATKYNGNIRYTPITNIRGAPDFWGIKSTITYGSSVILKPTVGIVDCGCTFIFIASDGYSKYQSATRSQYDHATKLLTIFENQLDALRSLNFHIGGQAYRLTPNAQIWPRSINTRIGGVEGSIYLVICDLGTISGQEDDFILGYVFMQRFYVAYDATGSRVGFATTAFTSANTN
ncbi:acid protease [Suillus decipiens]|nr:acid protease [Suillus decipiens]